MQDTGRRVQCLGKMDMVLFQKGADRVERSAQGRFVQLLECPADVVAEKGHAEYIAQGARVRALVAEEDGSAV